VTTRVEWLQVNLSLFPDSDGDRPYVPWESLAQEVAGWRVEDRFRRFWFVRKPPGLRLRFAGRELGARLEPALSAWLVEAEAANDVRGFRFGRYEPEEHRFGGPAGLAVAHDLFDRDTAVVLRYESLEDDRRGGIDRHGFALAALDDLFLRCVDDQAEVWDVWKRLEALVGDPHPGEAGTAAGHGWEALDESGRELAREAAAGNSGAATALRATADAGRLTRGVRSWLAAAAAFSWNRWGLPLDLAALAQGVAAMARLRMPDEPRASQAP
jgi:thiopeptide-type bacteriocin biosynthesis protein